MGDNTKIEWSDATWTPIRARNKLTGKVGWHCEHATPGCEFCYSESMNRRLGTGLPFKPGHRADIEIFLDENMLLQPLRWKRPRMIFVCSMTDLFGDFVTDAMIDQVFAIMALCPQHNFQVLTKRSARMRAYLTARGEPDKTASIRWAMLNLRERPAYLSPLPSEVMDWWEFGLPNVWAGVSAEDQRRADERVPDLLATPAAVRFVSAEPLLGPINFNRIHERGEMEGGGCWDSWESALNGKRFDIWSGGDVDGMPKIDWIIVGGESGPGARPMHPRWARSIRDQCGVTGTAFHFKQWGEWLDEREATARHIAPGPEMFDRFGAPKGDRWHPYEASDRNGGMMVRVGKKAAGRLLDGMEHNGTPLSIPTPSFADTVCAGDV